MGVKDIPYEKGNAHQCVGAWVNHFLLFLKESERSLFLIEGVFLELKEEEKVREPRLPKRIFSKRKLP